MPFPFHVTRWESDGYAGTDYATWKVLRSFFENARLIHSFAREALGDAQSRTPEVFDLSPIEWLTGKELPRIYGEIFRSKYKSWANETGVSDGVSFAVVALAAMGVSSQLGGRFSPATLLVHHRAANQLD